MAAVIAVQNARQVMEVCRTGMAQVDLILAEVELPKKRGFKMLKCFMKEENLKQIPIVSEYSNIHPQISLFPQQDRVTSEFRTEGAQ